MKEPSKYQKKGGAFKYSPLFYKLDAAIRSGHTGEYEQLAAQHRAIYVPYPAPRRNRREQ